MKSTRATTAGVEAAPVGDRAVDGARPVVTLFFRRLRETGNFSIETSFERMIASFPAHSPLELRSFTSSHFSNGLLPRLRGILEARRHRSDVNHVTGDAHYLVFGLPGSRTILTIHDCGFLQHPDRLARSLLRWLWLHLPVRHCRLVTTVSEATRQDVIRHSGCDPSKVVVVPTVISNSFVRTDREFDEGCPRILHIGMAPNKNFDRHVAALEGLRCRLHIVGKLEAEHRATLERHGVPYTWEYNISLEAMQRAYAESDVLLFASTLEGFGMPILEAQSVGRPVVTSSISSMPEVAGDGAIFADPFDVDSIRRAVLTVIQDSAVRRRVVELGFSNVQRFSARAVAEQYERIYRQICGPITDPA